MHFAVLVSVLCVCECVCKREQRQRERNQGRTLKRSVHPLCKATLPQDQSQADSTLSNSSCPPKSTHLSRFTSLTSPLDF